MQIVCSSLLHAVCLHYQASLNRLYVDSIYLFPEQIQIPLMMNETTSYQETAYNNCLSFQALPLRKLQNQCQIFYQFFYQIVLKRNLFRHFRKRIEACRQKVLKCILSYHTKLKQIQYKIILNKQLSHSTGAGIMLKFICRFQGPIPSDEKFSLQLSQSYLIFRSIDISLSGQIIDKSK